MRGTLRCLGGLSDSTRPYAVSYDIVLDGVNSRAKCGEHVRSNARPSETPHRRRIAPDSSPEGSSQAWRSRSDDALSRLKDIELTLGRYMARGRSITHGVTRSRNPIDHPWSSSIEGNRHERPGRCARRQSVGRCIVQRRASAVASQPCSSWDRPPASRRSNSSRARCGPERRFESLAPRDGEYRHHLRWGDDNGSIHVRARCSGHRSPYHHCGKTASRTWQQIALVESTRAPGVARWSFRLSASSSRFSVTTHRGMINGNGLRHAGARNRHSLRRGDLDPIDNRESGCQIERFPATWQPARANETPRAPRRPRTEKE